MGHIKEIEKFIIIPLKDCDKGTIELIADDLIENEIDFEYFERKKIKGYP